MEKGSLSRQAKASLDLKIRHRINAGRSAVKNEIGFFGRHFSQVGSDWKLDQSRVTFADIAISENIIAHLKNDFPQDDFWSEETNDKDTVVNLKGDFAWVLDPIDGTNNFALGFPLCAISLALLYEGIPIYGFVYDFSTGHFEWRRWLWFKDKRETVHSREEHDGKRIYDWYSISI